MKRCRGCGGKFEDPNSDVALCFACRLAACVPHWYEQAEAYYICTTHHILRARHTPRAGVDLLDTPHAQPIAAVLARMTEAEIESMRAAERAIL